MSTLRTKAPGRTASTKGTAAGTTAKTGPCNSLESGIKDGQQRFHQAREGDRTFDKVWIRAGRVQEREGAADHVDYRACVGSVKGAAEEF